MGRECCCYGVVIFSFWVSDSCRILCSEGDSICKFNDNVVATVGSNIVSQNYSDYDKKLTVYFLGGGKYEYENVDFNTYEGLLNAKHKQTFFDENIRDKFSYTKIY